MLPVVRIILWCFVDLEGCCGRMGSVGLSLACLAWIWFVSVTSSVVTLPARPSLSWVSPHASYSLAFLLQQ